MTNEEILEQIFDKGYVETKISLFKSFDIKLKSLSSQDYLDMDPLLTATTGTKLFVLQTYAIAKLCRALKNYGSMEFKTVEEAEKFIKTLPAAVTDKLLKEQTKFEKNISNALSPDSVEENFFEETGSVEKQELLPKE